MSILKYYKMEFNYPPQKPHGIFPGKKFQKQTPPEFERKGLKFDTKVLFNGNTHGMGGKSKIGGTPEA